MVLIAESDWQGSRWFGLPVKINHKTIVVEFAAEGAGKPVLEQLRCPNIQVLRHIKKHHVKTWAIPKQEVDDAINQ